MKFTKTQALGNDFIIVEEKDVPAQDLSFRDLSLKVCNRRYGIGADGMLLLFPHVTKRGAYFLRVFNSDGTEAESSGNGLRCSAAYLFHRNLSKSPTVEITTQAGWCQLELISHQLHRFSFLADMGMPILSPGAIPFQAPIGMERVINYSLPLGDSSIPVTVLSLGNPHCVLFFDSLADLPIEELGSVIETHSLFPNRTNVEFVQILNKEEIAVVFWERGVGETISSGSGASAAAAAAIIQGLVGNSLTIHTAGGDVLIDWKEGESLFLTGPAEIVYDGTFPDVIEKTS